MENRVILPYSMALYFLIIKCLNKSREIQMAINKANAEPIISPKEIWIGDKSAPVSLVMYGEYESETCEKANHVVNRLLEDYEGKVKFNFRHFPMMQVHQRSHKASEAAVA